jgi:biotin synthase-like enzyme
MKNFFTKNGIILLTAITVLAVGLCIFSAASSGTDRPDCRFCKFRNNRLPQLKIQQRQSIKYAARHAAAAICGQAFFPEQAR